MPLIGIGSTKNGISCRALMQTQLKVLQCPSDPTDKTSARRSIGMERNPPTLVAVTNYKGVLDDTFLGRGFRR